MEKIDTLEDIFKRISNKIENTKDEKPIKDLWLPTATVPNEICRVSPFFPLQNNQLSKRLYLKDEVIVENAWGRIVYSGPQLSVYDEDVLLALLAILSDPSKRKLTKVENVDTYKYEGSLLPIVRLAGLTKCKNNYDFVKSSCRTMMSSVFEIQTFYYKDGIKKTKSRILTNIMIFIHNDEKTNKHTFIINPYFFDLFTKGNFALIDIERRNRIKGNIAKSLYRFAISHQSTWKGHFLTLADAINLNKELPNYIKRHKIKKAIEELKKLKLLSDQSSINGDLVTICKHHSCGKARRKILTKKM